MILNKKILYCLTSNDTEGYQIYKIDIENYVTNVKNTPQELEITELFLFPTSNDGGFVFQ